MATIEVPRRIISLSRSKCWDLKICHKWMKLPLLGEVACMGIEVISIFDL